MSDIKTQDKPAVRPVVAGEKLRGAEKMARIPIKIAPTEPAQMLRKPKWIRAEFTGTQEDKRPEHVPLDLEPAVGAVAEEVADAGVAGADQGGAEDQPFGDEPGSLAGRIDPAAESKKRRHARPR